MYLQIKKKWFDMIVSGEKKEEYREIKPYYDTRFQNLFGFIMLERKGKIEILRGVLPEIEREPVQEIIFRNGYSTKAPMIKAKCSIRIGTGKEKWGAEKGKIYYILEIQSVEEIKNE